MGGVASVPTDDGRTMQVIGAGFSRTGTVSMALALEKLLDGPVCHGGTQMHMLGDEYPRRWVEVYRVRHDREKLLKALRDVTRGFVGITDMPGAQFIEELCEIYPEAKVVGVRRNKERWHQSAKTMVEKTLPWYMPILLWPLPTSRWFHTWYELAMEKVVEMEFLPFDPDFLTRHNDYVTRVVPPERLIWMDMKDGWEPLCKLLDKPIPDEPFPRANDSDDADEIFQRKVYAAYTAWSGIFGMLGIGAWAVMRFVRR